MTSIDKILMNYFHFKNECYNDKGELESIEYKTNYKYSKNIIIKFNLIDKDIDIQGETIPIELLEVILERCVELGYKKKIK